MRSPMARSSSGFLLPETGLCADAPVTQGRARLRLRSLGAIFFAAGLLMPVTRAFAFWDDKLQLFAEEKVTRDDNIFRISKDLDPATDTYHHLTRVQPGCAGKSPAFPNGLHLEC